MLALITDGIAFYFILTKAQVAFQFVAFNKMEDLKVSLKRDWAVNLEKGLESRDVSNIKFPPLHLNSAIDLIMALNAAPDYNYKDGIQKVNWC